MAAIDTSKTQPAKQEEAVPTLKKFWTVNTPDGGTWQNPTNGNTRKFTSLQEAMAFAIAKSAEQKAQQAVCECIAAVQPKAAVDHVQIVD